jgi:hypothetical protein
LLPTSVLADYYDDSYSFDWTLDVGHIPHDMGGTSAGPGLEGYYAVQRTNVADQILAIMALNNGSLFQTSSTTLSLEEKLNCKQAIGDAVTACQREVLIEGTVAGGIGTTGTVILVGSLGIPILGEVAATIYAGYIGLSGFDRTAECARRGSSLEIQLELGNHDFCNSPITISVPAA